MKKGDLVRMNSAHYNNPCGIVVEADNKHKVVRVLFSNPSIDGWAASRSCINHRDGVWRPQQIFEVVSEAK